MGQQSNFWKFFDFFSLPFFTFYTVNQFIYSEDLIWYVILLSFEKRFQTLPEQRKSIGTRNSLITTFTRLEVEYPGNCSVKYQTWCLYLDHRCNSNTTTITARLPFVISDHVIWTNVTSVIQIQLVCRLIKVRSHWTSMLTFASNFNIVSTVMLTLMQRMGTEHILCVCVLLPLLPLFSKTQTQTLTLSVNEPLSFVCFWPCNLN